MKGSTLIPNLGSMGVEYEELVATGGRWDWWEWTCAVGSGGDRLVGRARLAEGSVFAQR